MWKVNPLNSKLLHPFQVNLDMWYHIIYVFIALANDIEIIVQYN